MPNASAEPRSSVVAVGLRAGGDLRTKRAAAARPVLDDDLLPKALAHEHRQHAPERVGRSPAAKGTIILMGLWG